MTCTPFLSGELSALQGIQANGDGPFVVWTDEANPAICKAVLLSKKLVNARVRTGNGMCLEPKDLTVAFDLDDGISVEPPQPICASAVEPGRTAFIDDPEPRLLPRSVRSLCAQHDDFTPDLDHGKMSKHRERRDDDEDRGSKKQVSQFPVLPSAAAKCAIWSACAFLNAGRAVARAT
jgi:hypothetical protein